MENNYSQNGASLSCFREWMSLQEQDLSELLQARNLCNTDGGSDHTVQLQELVQKNIQHLQEYVSRRATLARDDISSYFCPTWCSSLEGSMLWAGGCRPSMFIRHVYSLSGKEINAQIQDLNDNGNGGFGWLSASQLMSINDLQMKTVREEDRLSSKLASLQEDIADDPIATIAENLQEHSDDSPEANDALDIHAVSMKALLEEADNLRMNILIELVGVMSPIQAVQFLAASKKLDLCMHEWGRRRDQEHGRNFGSE